jgi:nitrogen regulatory protein PII
MTKKLEEEFNLPPIEDVEDKPTEKEIVEVIDVEDVEKALTTAEKIDNALRNVKGLDEHDTNMDDIAQQAVDSYQQLMNLGMNVSDRDAGSIFDSAAKMLKTALDAKDSKINSKLKQIDMMIKKARLDTNTGSNDDSSGPQAALDRNELLKIINTKED